MRKITLEIKAEDSPLYTATTIHCAAWKLEVDGECKNEAALYRAISNIADNYGFANIYYTKERAL